MTVAKAKAQPRKPPKKPKPQTHPNKPKPGATPVAGSGGSTTNTTSSPGDVSGGQAAAVTGDLTGASMTSPSPNMAADQQADQDMQAFFSSGVGPAYHYDQVSQFAESPPVQNTTQPGTP